MPYREGKKFRERKDANCFKNEKPINCKRYVKPQRIEHEQLGSVGGDDYRHQTSEKANIKNSTNLYCSEGLCSRINVSNYLKQSPLISLDSFAFGRGKVKGEFKAIKFRLYPNKQQREILGKTFGCSRFIWNLMLTERKNIYALLKHDKEALFDYFYKTETIYKKHFPFLSNVDSIALQQSRIDLITAYKNFFDGSKSGRKVGFPRFKSKRGKQTYRTTMTNNNLKLDFHQKCIKLPKIKSWIKYRDDRVWDIEELPIRSITVSKTKSGKYFASIHISHASPTPLTQVRESHIGAFDMSFSNFLIGAEKQFKNPHFYRSELARLGRYHRYHSRKKKGSKNREKARIKLSRHYDKITNRKKDWTHKKALKLAKDYDAVVLEDLNIRAMQQFNKGWAKTISFDFSWNMFKTILKYKLKWHGKLYQEVGRFYPSSKLCSVCGYKKTDLQLKDREWTCPSCGTHHNRDINSAVNIKVEGIRLLKDRGIKIISS